jgi:hypothetical protein
MIWYFEHAMRQNDSHALHLILHDALLLKSSFPGWQNLFTFWAYLFLCRASPFGRHQGEVVGQGLGEPGIPGSLFMSLVHVW